MSCIFLTGSTSGVGGALLNQLQKQGHQVIECTRAQVDLNDLSQVQEFVMPQIDLLINCAGHGLGGKQPWLTHSAEQWIKILNTNLIAPMLLCQSALKVNPECKIVNITSTNNNKYYANDLAYSLSKKALAEFGHMLRVDHPTTSLLEVRLGLTRTQFNANRYSEDVDRFKEIYNQPCLEPTQVAEKIINAIMDTTVKELEISP